MPVIQIRQIRRVKRGNSGPASREGIQVSGAITATGRVGTYVAGSFELNHIDTIMLGPSPVAGQRRAVYGSVRNPMGSRGNDSWRNSVQLGVILTGSAGTRSTTMATIGSKAGAGTAASAYFIAYGY